MWSCLLFTIKTNRHKVIVAIMYSLHYDVRSDLVCYTRDSRLPIHIFISMAHTHQVRAWIPSNSPSAFLLSSIFLDLRFEYEQMQQNSLNDTYKQHLIVSNAPKFVKALDIQLAVSISL